MTRIVNWRTVAPLLTAALLMGGLAEAKVTKEMGNILSTDWRAMEMEIKNPRGRTKTWKVARDCTVKFTDKKSDFPNPKLTDLRPPMYIHFKFMEGTNVIQNIDVREVGFEPSTGGPGVQVQAVITNLDANIGHVEVKLDTGITTFKVDPKNQLKAFKQGQKVTILIETRNGEEFVTVIKPR